MEQMKRINTIMTTKAPITLRPLRGEDIPLFSQWLDKDYIYKRLCPDGEQHREAWLNEVCNKDGKYDFLTHFIVYYGDKKIGYCLHADCFFTKKRGTTSRVYMERCPSRTIPTRSAT